MKSGPRRTLLRAGGWLLAFAAATVTAFNAAAVQPIENFTKWPAIEDVAVSPSGKRLAVTTFGPNGMRRLGVMSLDPIGAPRLIANYSDADVIRVEWVNDERLVFKARSRDVGAAVATRTFAINADGSGQRLLISWEAEPEVYERRKPTGPAPLGWDWFFYGPLGAGGDDVLVYKQVRDNLGDVTEINMSRLNTSTGELRSLSKGLPERSMAWMFDASDEPRMVVSYKAGRSQVHWLDAQTRQWKQVASFDDFSPEGFTPWFVDADGRVLVLANGQEDTRGIYKFDPQVGRVDPEALVQVRGFDLSPLHERDSQTGRLLGFHFKADRPMSYWFDDRMAQLQKTIDAALPAGRNNRLYCGRCESTRYFVVKSTSDRQPGEFFLFDREASALQRIGASRPWIVEEEQGRRSFHRMAARDGLSIPVYVTHPAGSDRKQPLPAVVLVHGGPWVRGADTDWEAEAQFLSSRGYRVLEPEFRGSEGYGGALFRASWKQWGRAMQDDLVDTVQWAARQGLIDPSRVCIMGSSYGGYAALMGPIAAPGVFRCAVSFAGVTDIGLMSSISWSDMSQDYLKYGMKTLVGDPESEADRLDQVSPLKRAREIKVPVLLGHGTLDRRVPVKHARDFVSAAQSGKVAIEAVYYKESGHGFYQPADQTDFYQRVEKLLDKSLKPAEK